MISTGIFFICLLKKINAGAVCDVGSLDGGNAVLFKKALPDARVMLFEANPHNFAKIQKNPLLADLEQHHLAVSDIDGELEFYVARADYQAEYDDRHSELGMSSLYQRGDMEIQEKVRVASTRLDSFFAANHPHEERIALWVDAEGADYEVLSGMGDLAEKVWLVHVEVATQPIFEGHKLADQVEELMGRLGFEPIADNFQPGGIQGDVVYASRKHMAQIRPHIRGCKTKERMVNTLRLQKLAQRILPRPVHALLKRVVSRFVV